MSSSIEIFKAPKSNGWTMPHIFLPPEIVGKIFHHKSKTESADRFKHLSERLEKCFKNPLESLKSSGFFFPNKDAPGYVFSKTRRECSIHCSTFDRAHAGFEVTRIESLTQNTHPSFHIVRYFPLGIMHTRDYKYKLRINILCDECCDWMSLHGNNPYDVRFGDFDAMWDVAKEKARAMERKDPDPCLRMKRLQKYSVLVYVECDDYGCDGRKRCDDFRMKSYITEYD